MTDLSQDAGAVWVSTAIAVIFPLFIFSWAVQRFTYLGHPFHRDKNCPRMVPYYLPFFGSGFEFWHDMISFILKWRNYFDSDVFSFYMGGKTFIYIHDPVAASVVSSGRMKHLHWNEAKYRMMKNGLGSTHFAADTWITKGNLKSEHAIVEKHLLSAEYLDKNLLKYQQYVIDKMFPWLLGDSKSDWKQIGVKELMGKSVFFATCETVFGFRSLMTEKHYDMGMNFEKRFPKFTGLDYKLWQMSDWDGYSNREKMVKDFNSIFENLMKTIDKKVDNPGDDEDYWTDIVKEYGKIAYDNMNLDDISRFNMLFFGASFMNTVPAAVWTFYELLRNPKAYKHCYDEITSIAKARITTEEEKKENDSLFVPFTLDEIESMEVLESTFNEVLRLRSTTKMLRLRIAEETFHLNLKLPYTGKKMAFDMPKGAYVISCPTVMHRDPEIFKDPLEFKYDRFMKGPDGNPPTFYKNGIKLLRPVDAWGGGSTLCPGRRFARTEIKALVAQFMLFYETRWVDGVVPEPPVDTTRIVNAGMPNKEVYVEVRKREIAP